MSPEILVVDDEPDIRDLISGVLEDEGYAVRTAGTAEAALDQISARKPSLVVLDVWLQGSGMDGLELLKYLKSIDPYIGVIIISGHGSVETAVTAIQEGAYDYIEKPFNAERLLFVCQRAIETSALQREHSALMIHSSLGEELLGSSAAATQLRSSIEKVAPTNSRILISGPPGAGKEHAAKLIHMRSKRAGGPFLAVNAASISPEDMEARLFGEESDDGRPRTIGLFEQCHNGTLYLDEIGDMPLGTQNKILRVLTEQRFRRKGGTTDVGVDVRLVSSTSKDLRSEIEAERFREDLYYRINVVPLTVPPLADRREDIPNMIEHFVRRAVTISGLTYRPFSEEAIAVLQSADWPGNVRQLKNIIERVLILSTPENASPISADELPKESLSEGSDQGIKSSLDVIGMTLKDARERFEREYLALQITRFGGNISRTAAFIGMERSALHRKLKALGVDPSQTLKGA